MKRRAKEQLGGPSGLDDIQLELSNIASVAEDMDTPAQSSRPTAATSTPAAGAIGPSKNHPLTQKQRRKTLYV